LKWKSLNVATASTNYTANAQHLDGNQVPVEARLALRVTQKRDMTKPAGQGIPCRRNTSAVFSPVSCAMIYSSVNSVSFFVPLFGELYPNLKEF
jgi:hypothetical protein